MGKREEKDGIRTWNTHRLDQEGNDRTLRTWVKETKGKIR